MITIINKCTGEEITKYSGAIVSESTKDSFIANVKGKWCFRSQWHAVVDFFIPIGSRAVQCLLKDPFVVKECL